MHGKFTLSCAGEVTSEFAKKDENCVTMPFHGQPDYRNCNWGECKSKATTKLLGISSLDMLQMSKFTLGTMQPASFLILVIILSLGLVGKLNSAAIPDAVVIMIVAACYAAIVRYAVYGGVHFGEWIYEILQDFVEPVMHLVLLPITIYEGGFNIQRKNFFSQFGSLKTFARVLAFTCRPSGPGSWTAFRMGGRAPARSLPPALSRWSCPSLARYGVFFAVIGSGPEAQQAGTCVPEWRGAPCAADQLLFCSSAQRKC